MSSGAADLEVYVLRIACVGDAGREGGRSLLWAVLADHMLRQSRVPAGASPRLLQHPTFVCVCASTLTSFLPSSSSYAPENNNNRQDCVPQAGCCGLVLHGAAAGGAAHGGAQTRKEKVTVVCAVFAGVGFLEAGFAGVSALPTRVMLGGL